jgi:hypothetical protein
MGAMGRACGLLDEQVAEVGGWLGHEPAFVTAWGQRTN